MMVSAGIIGGRALARVRDIPEAPIGQLGTVVNGTTGQPLRDALVTLIRKTNQGLQVLGSAKSDAQGKFRFPPDGGGEPITLQTTYEGVIYEEAFPSGTLSSAASLKVFEASRSPESAVVKSNLIYLQPTGSQIDIQEMVNLNNQSATTFANPELGGFRFYFPPNAYDHLNVTVEAPGSSPASLGAETTEEPNVLKLDYPIRPGETRFDIRYSLPMSDRFEGKLVGIAGQPAGILRLAVPDGIVLKGPDLVFDGRVPKADNVSVFDVTATNAFAVTMRQAGSRVRQTR
jgi:hypothetical protein